MYVELLLKLLYTLHVSGSAISCSNCESHRHVTPPSPALHGHGLYRYYRARLSRASLWCVLREAHSTLTSPSTITIESVSLSVGLHFLEWM